jgi:hypothetical protein
MSNKISKLAIFGGIPVVNNQLKLYRSIGTEEKFAVNKVITPRKLSQFIVAMCDDFYGA